jgi:hypothetical protein
MKRAALLVVLASMAGAAFAQVEDRKEGMRPRFDTHQPIGAEPTPGLPPVDRKDEFGYRVESTPAYQPRRYNSEVDAEAGREREWQRRRYQADHPYQPNFGGDPYQRGSRTADLPTPRRTSSPYTSTPYRSSGSSGSSSNGREYPRSDPNWLRPNFGSSPPRPAPTHPYGFNTPQPRATTSLYGTPPKRCGSPSPYSFSPC